MAEKRKHIAGLFKQLLKALHAPEPIFIHLASLFLHHRNIVLRKNYMFLTSGFLHYCMNTKKDQHLC